MLISHDSYLLDRWDHTAHTAAMIHNLSIVVIGLVSKNPPKPRPFSYFHPFRKSKRRGLSVTPDNMEGLRAVANAFLSAKGR